MQIETKKLTHVFDIKMPNEHVALKDVDCVIKQGQYIGVIGHTGSGKTTFIEHLNALLIPTYGEVIIGDRIIHNTKKKIKNIKDLRKKVGVVFQFAEYQLFEETVEKDIMFGPLNMGKDIEESKKLASKYIEIVGMDKEFLKASPFALSGGQKRRVALAGILAMEPDVLIFDEPTAGLDPQGAKDILHVFDKLNKDGKTVLIVTHNLDYVLEHTKKTIVFRESKLIKFEDTYKILNDEKFLRSNELYPPKLITFKNKLESRGIKIGKVTSIKQLVEKLNKV